MTVRLAGAFGVSRNGAPQDGALGGSRKARRLLMLLAAHRGRLVPVDRVVEVLWPERPPQRPVRDVATLVSRLRATLGPDVVVGGRAGYRLGDPPAVRIDLDEAGRLIEESRARLAAGDSRLAAAAGRRACDLLGAGPALTDEPDDRWVADVRFEHAELVRAARHHTGEAMVRAGDALAAAELAEAAIRADRFDEVAYRVLMAAYQKSGEPARALTAYERLRADLAESLGVDPAPETRSVHMALLAEVDPPPTTSGARRVSGCVGLVGRVAELAQLTEAWSAASAGDPSLLLVTGEGGIGKTRLAEELAVTAETTGGRVLQVRCYASERSLFLQPVVEALAPTLEALPAGRLRELAGPRAAALAGLMPELVHTLGPVDPPSGSADVEVRRAFEVLATVLRGLAAERPTLLLLDDLHNTGLATVDLLHYLARHAGSSRLLVVATLRAEEGAAALDELAEVGDRLDVGPLSAEAVARLAAEVGRADLASTILRRTRGHTLFVVETLRALAAGETRADETLQAVVLTRLRGVGAETEELLRAGAVLGASVDPAVVAGMLDLPPHVAAQRCARAAAARLLLVADRHYEFANDLIQEVLYDTTPMPVRIIHHRRAADLSAATPEVVARHAAAAQDWPRAARAFLVAGEQALARFAAADAEGLLCQALAAAELIGAPELVCRSLLARGRSQEIRGIFRPAFDDYQAALNAARQAGDQRQEMRALRELGGHTPTSLGVPIQESTDRLWEGLAVAESLGDRAMEADLRGRLAIMHSGRLRFTAAIELGQRAVGAGRAAHSDRALARGLDGLKTAYAYLGETRLLTEVVDELEPLLRRLGDMEWLAWTVFESAFPCVAAARWDEADSKITEAADICRQALGLNGMQCFVAHLGWVARLQGRMDAAVEYGRAAVDMTRPEAEPWFGPTAAGLLARSLVEIGETAAAVELVDRAVGDASRGGAEAYLLRCLAPLAELTGSTEVLEQADALLTGISAPPGSAWLLGADAYVSVARAWLANDEPDRARAVLVPLLAAARRLQWIPVIAEGELVDATARMIIGDPRASAALAAVAALAKAHHMPLLERAARDLLA